jgi:hypothetical protein
VTYTQHMALREALGDDNYAQEHRRAGLPLGGQGPSGPPGSVCNQLIGLQVYTTGRESPYRRPWPALRDRTQRTNQGRAGPSGRRFAPHGATGDVSVRTDARLRIRSSRWLAQLQKPLNRSTRTFGNGGMRRSMLAYLGSPSLAPTPLAPMVSAGKKPTSARPIRSGGETRYSFIATQRTAVGTT